MRGIKATLPAHLPVMISTSTTRIVKHRTIRRVPLHSPADGLKLRNRITGAPILSDNLCEGMPLTSKVLRNSEGYVFATSVSFAESALRKSTCALGRQFKTIVFINETSLLRGAKIARSCKYSFVAWPSCSQGQTATTMACVSAGGSTIMSGHLMQSSSMVSSSLLPRQRSQYVKVRFPRSG